MLFCDVATNSFSLPRQQLDHVVFINATIHHKLFDIAHITFLVFTKRYTRDDSWLVKFQRNELKDKQRTSWLKLKRNGERV